MGNVFNSLNNALNNKPMSSNPLNTLLNDSPFVINSQNINISQEIISRIYIESHGFSKSLKSFYIDGKEYDIDFFDQGETVTIKINKNSESILKLNNILKKPFEVTFEDIDEIKAKTLSIFRINAYNKLLYFLSTKLNEYSYIEDQDKKTLIIKKKIFKIPEELIIEAKNISALNLFNSIEKTVSINPLLLSYNFYHIFPEVSKDENYILILNKERLELFQKLINFIDSNKKFYYITGSDGIGKSISLLYFSLFNNYQFIYFNIKIYSNLTDEEEFRNFFINDLYKFYLFNHEYDNKEIINEEFSRSIEKIEEEVNNIPKKINKIFKYIISFMHCFGGEKYIMIIDQYKSDDSDPDFEGLNEIINFYYNTKQNVKFIISSSINNTSNKLALLRNLSNIQLDLSQNDLSKLIYSQNLDNINLYNNENILPIENEIKESDDVLGDKFECDFCEKIFNEEKKKRTEKIKENQENSNYFKIDSKCLLDNKYLEDTIKDYYSNLVNGRDLFKKILSTNEYILYNNS